MIERRLQPVCRSVPFTLWKTRFRFDCELHGKLLAFDAMGDSILQLLWEVGLEPSVEGVIEGSRELDPN